MTAVDSLVYQIEEYLKDDGPFESEDDVERYINESIDCNLIYDDDIFDLAKCYINGQDLLREFSMDLYSDIHSQFDYSDWVEEEEEEDWDEEEEDYDDEDED